MYWQFQFGLHFIFLPITIIFHVAENRLGVLGSLPKSHSIDDLYCTSPMSIRDGRGGKPYYQLICSGETTITLADSDQDE